MLAQEQKVLQSTVETMYRVNADEYTRALIAAREDQLRQEISTQYAHKQQLEALNKTIGELGLQLADKDQQLADKDQQLADKDHQLADKDQQLVSKDAEIARLKALLNMRKSL